MKHHAAYLRSRITTLVIPSIRGYKESVLRYVLPGFDSIEKDAEQLANDIYDNAPFDENMDPADVAEMAGGQAQDFYDMMAPVKQTMLNLITAGLFHHLEQQLFHISNDRLFCYEENRPRGPKMSSVRKWYVEEFSLDLESLPSWPVVEQLRLLANTVKHGELQPDTPRLRAIRPQLFENPIYDDMPYDPFPVPANRVNQPLAGEDLYVRKADFEMYANGVESFVAEIAAHFDAHSR